MVLTIGLVVVCPEIKPVFPPKTSVHWRVAPGVAEDPESVNVLVVGSKQLNTAGETTVTLGFATMLTFNTAGGAHTPADGVNVYGVEPTIEVLIVAGDQVPEIPSFETLGKVGAAAPSHAEIALNVGVAVDGAV